MQAYNLHSTPTPEPAEQGQPLSGTMPREQGSPPVGWEGYSPDVLEALFDSDGPSADW
jgi:hypothetical protein